MFFYIILLTSVLSVYYSDDIKKRVKLVPILIEALLSAYKEKNTQITYSKINTKNVIKFGNFNLPCIKSMHNYDIKCVNLETNIKDETSDYHPVFDSKHEIDMKLVRYGDNLTCIPFRPMDYDFNNLYVLIKRISEQSYTVFKFSSCQYINYLDILHRYENIIELKKQNTVLAEAYDDD